MSLPFAPLLFVALGLGAPPAGAAPVDSTTVLREARSLQERFERFRETRTPAELRTGGSRCDEPIGRLCLVYPVEGAERAPIVPPRPEVVDARREMLDSLSVLGDVIPGDEWILGQRVRYLVESGDLIGARQLMQDCRARAHWCAALTGLVHHEEGEWIEAGRAFLEVLESLPPNETGRWTGEAYLLERAGRAFLDVSDPEEQLRRRALLWRLSDPLFSVPGNARWTAHMARLTQVRILEDAWNPFGLPWDVDLEEIVLRYGWAMGWERGRTLPGSRGSMQQLGQNRMTARLDPDRRRYLPRGEELADFPQGDDGDLRVGTGRQPEGFTPSYAPVIENFQSQTARFLREGSILVVHAFARDPDDGAETADRAPPSDLRTALYVLPVDGPVIEEDPTPVAVGAALEGIWSARVPAGRDHILSLESWSRLERTAWRTRRALPELPSAEGRIRLSDPVFLVPDDDLPPETLDEAMGSVRSSLRFPPGEPLRIGWEVYGLVEGDEAAVSMGVERAERSRLRAIGEFFRVIEPPQTVTIRWDEAPESAPGIVFRAVDLFVPELDEGAYDLFLEVRVPGEEPAVTRRRLIVGVR